MLKDLVVHLSGSQEDEARLAFAEAISERFGARLRGVYVHMEPEPPEPSPEARPDASSDDDRHEQAAARAEETLRRLKVRFKSLAVPHDLQQVSVTSRDAGQSLAGRARTADLYIGPLPDPESAHDLQLEISVLSGSGRSCLFVPSNMQAQNGFATIVVAWNGSREAARAVSEAMPFLEQAGLVVLSTVSEDDMDARRTDIARHLLRYGVPVVLSDAYAGPDGVGAALLEEVRKVGADLLVMGGYGPPPAGSMGAVTRSVLAGANVPVLMAS